MKRLLSISIILLFIGFSISYGTGINTTNLSFKPISSGNILYVGGSGPGNYSKIQNAIDNASDGDTVFVYNGTYYENIFVDKPINLIGEIKKTTVIDGNFFESVICILSDNVNISGFTIQNSGDNWFEAGIDIRAKNNTTLINNIISNNCWGILLFESKNNYIENNSISINKDGIIYLNSSNNTIISNYISNNGFGIHFESSVNNIITDNNISNNDGFGIYLIHCNRNKIKDNIITNNEFSGIFLYKDSRFNTIINNIIKSNGNHGVRVIESINNTFMLNDLISNKWDGIFLYSSNNNTIIFNDIISNNDFGICLDGYSNSNTVKNNTILKSRLYGLCISYSSINTIIGNIISDNEYGIWIYNSSNNKIVSANNISNNKHGVYLNSSNANSFYHNNFINNTQNSYDNGDNTWDDAYPSGGNYWDNYTGNDSEGDGIGDTQYPIPGGDNQDRYPLMKPYGSQPKIFVGTTGPLCPLLNIAEIELIDGNESQIKKIERILNNRILHFILPVTTINVTGLNFSIIYNRENPSLFILYLRFLHITVITENGSNTFYNDTHKVIIKGMNGVFSFMRWQLRRLIPPRFVFYGSCEEVMIEYPKGE